MSNWRQLELDQLWIYCRAPVRILLSGMAVLAVFLPSYIINPHRCGHSLSILSSCVKDRGVEGLNNIGYVNQQQQKYFLSQNKFGKSLAEIDTKILPDTPNFSYRIVQNMNPGYNWKLDKKRTFETAIIIARPQKNYLNGYFGLVYYPKIFSKNISDKTNIQVIFCRSEKTLGEFGYTISMPFIINGQIQCPLNYKKLN